MKPGRPDRDFSLRMKLAADAAASKCEPHEPLDYLLAIMRDRNAPVQARIRAAGMAAPYIHRKQPVEVVTTSTGYTPRTIIVESVTVGGADAAKASAERHDPVDD